MKQEKSYSCFAILLLLLQHFSSCFQFPTLLPRQIFLLESQISSKVPFRVITLNLTTSKYIKNVLVHAMFGHLTLALPFFFHLKVFGMLCTYDFVPRRLSFFQRCLVERKRQKEHNYLMNRPCFILKFKNRQRIQCSSNLTFQQFQRK